MAKKAKQKKTQPARRSGTIASDLPASTDRLDFEAYVETLADVVTDIGTQTPLTIGVFGPWGSGKTSLMDMVRRSVHEKVPGYPLVWFDAWKYDREGALWRALVLRVVHAVRELPHVKEDKEKQKRFDDLEDSLYRVVDREELGGIDVDFGSLLKGGGKMLVHMGLHMLPMLSGFAKLLEEGQKQAGSDDLNLLFDGIKRKRHQIYREHVQSLEQFQETFAKLLADNLTVDEEDDSIGDYLRKALVARREEGHPDIPLQYRLVVFIDDLDRCLPEKAVEVLEAIKLFMDVPGCVFILGLDYHVISRGIEIKYRELRPKEDDPEAQRQFVIQGTKYLEKIIQLPFHIPSIEPDQMQRYVEGLAEWPDAACAQVFGKGIRASPRQVKRTVNSFLLLWKLAGHRKLETITPVRLAKVVAIQQMAPQLYEMLRETPRLLAELEAYYQAGHHVEQRELQESTGTEEVEAATLSPVLQPYVSRHVLQDLLTLKETSDPEYCFSSLGHEALNEYFSLTRRTETVEPIEARPDIPRSAIEPQVVFVPAGAFMMGSDKEEVERLIEENLYHGVANRETPQHEVRLSAYSIGKYPITNVEFQHYIRSSAAESPASWEGDQYPEGKGDHPVVGVNWEEAMAYCSWLSEQTGKHYSLPTEAQWEKAARGSQDRRRYPWGDEWDPDRLNSNEKARGTTTPVSQYAPDDESPYHCSSMVGNVLEWCLDWFDASFYQRWIEQGRTEHPEGPDQGTSRVVRGGSFNDSRRGCRCAFRHYFEPNTRRSSVGFRVLLLPSATAAEY